MSERSRGKGENEEDGRGGKERMKTGEVEVERKQI